jgi:hypothetical protein
MRGEFYKLVDAKWLGLKEYVRTLMPDIQVSTVEIDIVPLNPSPSNGTFAFPLASKLPIASTATIMAAIAGIEWKPRDQVNTWWTQIPNAAPIVRVTADPPLKQGASKNIFDFVLNWTVGPNDNTIVNNPSLSITKLTVSYVIVFFP